MVDYSDAGESVSHYQTMASALQATDRSIVFQICQWGVGTDIGNW